MDEHEDLAPQNGKPGRPAVIPEGHRQLWRRGRGAFDLADRIRAARAQKPVQALVAEHGLPAGYVLASHVDRIILPRTEAMGSIGVVALHTDMCDAVDQRAIAGTMVHAESHQLDDNPSQPLPEM